MKGKVRTKDKCPVCQGKFVEIPKMGFICKEHLTTPGRLYVDFWYKKQIKIYSDKYGKALDTYERARSLLNDISEEIEHGSFNPTYYVKAEQKKFYVATLLDKFLESKLTGVDSIAPSYMRHYRRYVGIAMEYFGIKDVREIRKLDIINYNSYVSENYRFSSKTLKNCVDIFKTFLMYVKNDLELISTVPHFPVINVPEPKVTWLTSEVQRLVFDNVPEHDKPIMAFLMLSGCRPGEARALKCRDVDLAGKSITISATFSDTVYRQKRKGKKAKSVTIPIHDEILEYFNQRVGGNLPDAYIFVNKFGRHYSESSMQRMWKKIREKVGLDQSVRLYDARHSFASQLVNSGVPIYSVQKLLGHSDVKTTQKYAHNNLKNLKVDVSNLSLQKKVLKLKEVALD